VAPPLNGEPASGATTVDKSESDKPAAEPKQLEGLASAARATIHFWKSVVAALAAGYQAGFLWVAAVGIYLLLRRDIDGVQMNEVYIDQSDEYGMPPLAEDISTGVPDVAPVQPAPPGDGEPG
jgi:hypothetical protein